MSTGDINPAAPGAPQVDDKAVHDMPAQDHVQDKTIVDKDDVETGRRASGHGSSVAGESSEAALIDFKTLTWW